MKRESMAITTLRGQFPAFICFRQHTEDQLTSFTSGWPAGRPASLSWPANKSRQQIALATPKLLALIPVSQLGSFSFAPMTYDFSLIRRGAQFPPFKSHYGSHIRLHEIVSCPFQLVEENYEEEYLELGLPQIQSKWPQSLLICQWHFLESVVMHK